MTVDSLITGLFSIWDLLESYLAQLIKNKLFYDFSLKTALPSAQYASKIYEQRASTV